MGEVAGKGGKTPPTVVISGACQIYILITFLYTEN